MTKNRATRRDERRRKQGDSKLNQQEYEKKMKNSEENQWRFMKNPWRIEEDDEENLL
jgi:hypothetical protein